jgi:hypothetical protein
LLDWSKLYNEQRMIERHGFKPPAQRRREYYAATQKLAV